MALHGYSVTATNMADGTNAYWIGNGLTNNFD